MCREENILHKAEKGLNRIFHPISPFDTITHTRLYLFSISVFCLHRIRTSFRIKGYSMCRRRNPRKKRQQL